MEAKPSGASSVAIALIRLYDFKQIASFLKLAKALGLEDDKRAAAKKAWLEENEHSEKERKYLTEEC